MYQLMYVMHLIWLKYILQFHMPLKIFFTERLHLKTLSQVVTLQLPVYKDTFILTHAYTYNVLYVDILVVQRCLIMTCVHRNIPFT